MKELMKRFCFINGPGESDAWSNCQLTYLYTANLCNFVLVYFERIVSFRNFPVILIQLLRNIENCLLFFISFYLGGKCFPECQGEWVQKMFDFLFHKCVMGSHHLVLHNKIMDFKPQRDRCERVTNSFNCFAKFCRFWMGLGNQYIYIIQFLMAKKTANAPMDYRPFHLILTLSGI